jgi:hypothetical protein
MSLFNNIKSFYSLLFFIFIFFATKSFAADSIYAKSINWDDEKAKTHLLNTVPKWDYNVLQSLFKVYKNPENFKLPHLSDKHKYNIQYIHAHWGPLNNPFNKYSRPAKVFLFFNKTSGTNPDVFYMAPIIKSQTDGNFYVFDESRTKPLLLNDWVAELQHQHNSMNTKFNICLGYGNYPNDTCAKSYQAEAKDILKRVNLFQREGINLNSSHREPHENWQNKVKIKALADSIYQSSISWDNEVARNKLLNTTIAWSSDEIKENFEKLRDIRYYTDYEVANFRRRISWLYPDDGCWTRATATIKDLFGPFNFSEYKSLNSKRPSKIFAFGNLCVNTANSPFGYVTWWYHTAPIVKNTETNLTYVLDPSINPKRPMEVSEWINAISSNTQKCAGKTNGVSKFNICNGYGTAPYSICDSTYNEEIHEMILQTDYQRYERERQIELGRNPDEVLGDSPPWLT